MTSITRAENGYFEILGTSLPAEFGTNHVVFGILEQKSKSLAEKNFEIRKKLPEKTLANLAKVILQSYSELKKRVFRTKRFFINNGPGLIKHQTT